MKSPKTKVKVKVTKTKVAKALNDCKFNPEDYPMIMDLASPEYCKIKAIEMIFSNIKEAIKLLILSELLNEVGETDTVRDSGVSIATRVARRRNSRKHVSDGTT
jgi:hypothetical protein